MRFRPPAVALALAALAVAAAAVGHRPAIAQETGTLTGTIRVPWSRHATSAVAIYVEGTTPQPADPPPVLDQRELTFDPRVLAVPVGSSVAFLNSDPFLHNVFSPSTATKEFDLGTYAAGVEKTVEFDRPGVVVVLCNVHPQMASYIIVFDAAFLTVSAETGRFRIEGLPPGRHRVELWNETADPGEAWVEIVGGEEAQLDYTFERRRRVSWIRDPR